MKRLLLFFMAGGYLLPACNNQTSTNKEKMEDSTQAVTPASPNTTAEMPAPPMDSAAMMKAWEAYMTPGEPHKMLAKDNGTWIGEITMWEKPDAPPTKTTGTAVISSILGGRYQQSVHTATFWGKPFEGRSTVAYDNAKKQFESTWIDNMGTGIMHLTGTWDSAAKTVNYTGTCVDPMSGKDMGVREVVTMIDDNTQKMEMYMKPAGGTEFKSMEILSKRKK